MTITRFTRQYEFLSNFHDCSVYMDDIDYPSAEHAFQAQKTEDLKEREQIAKCSTPSKAKRAGRAVKLRKGWDELRIACMTIVVRAKFIQNPVLRNKLLDTGTEKLVEGNYWGDTFWGVCDGVGENHLGKILMRVRDELQRNRSGK